METTQHYSLYLLEQHITPEGLRFGRWTYAVAEMNTWIEYYALYQDDILIAYGTYNEADEYADFTDLLPLRERFCDDDDYLSYLFRTAEPDFDEGVPPAWVKDMWELLANLSEKAMPNVLL